MAAEGRKGQSQPLIEPVEELFPDIRVAQIYKLIREVLGKSQRTQEAQLSVLAAYCGRSQYASQGERVVAGQHLMQAECDIFLGWTRVTVPDGVGRDAYVRQLKDWKFSAPIEQMIPSGMKVYARMCGWTLARAHARSGKTAEPRPPPGSSRNPPRGSA